MNTYRFTTRGRITIPFEIRKKYKLTPGRCVGFKVIKGGIKIIPLATPEEIKVNVGILGMKGKLLKSFMKEKKMEREL